jgi:phage shock protein C
MFCTKCGQTVTDEAFYCSRCGHETGLGQARHAGGGFAPRRLYRLAHDKKIAGICAGLARYLDTDVTLVRILTVAVVCVTGFVPGLVAYLITWMIMPVDEGVQHSPVNAQPAATNVS